MLLALAIALLIMFLSKQPDLTSNESERTNYSMLELIHWLKESNWLYCIVPLTRVQKAMSNETLDNSLTFARRLDGFFRRFLSSFREMNDSYCAIDLDAWIEAKAKLHPDIRIDAYKVLGDTGTNSFRTNKLEFEMLLDTLFHNCYQSMMEMESEKETKSGEKTIDISYSRAMINSAFFIEVSITSLNTVAISSDVLGHQPVNAGSGKMGLGLFLVNEQLKRMSAIRYDDGLFFLKGRAHPVSGRSGFTVTFNLPEKLSI